MKITIEIEEDTGDRYRRVLGLHGKKLSITEKLIAKLAPLLLMVGREVVKNPK